MLKQCDRHMRVEERETLSLGLVHGWSLRTMAAVMGRAFSMVNREHVRNAAKGPDRLVPVRRTPWQRPRRARPLNSDFFLFSSIFSKTQYSTDVVSKACEPGQFSCGHPVMPLSQPMR
jgi:IS30 family transposase